jgi:hypothetical protein
MVGGGLHSRPRNCNADTSQTTQSLSPNGSQRAYFIEDGLLKHGNPHIAPDIFLKKITLTEISTLSDRWLEMLNFRKIRVYQSD